VALALAVSLAACGGKGPSPGEQANEVAIALQGLATDPVALVSSKASAEVRDSVDQLFVPGSIVKPDVQSWAPDGPGKGTMVVTVEPPDQDTLTVIVVVIIEDEDWKIFDLVDEETLPSPTDSPTTAFALRPMVFELIGQPPDAVVEQLGEWDYVSEYNGVRFIYADFDVSFTDYTGEWGPDYMSGPRPAGVCWEYHGQLKHIVDSPPGPISIAALGALFGETGQSYANQDFTGESGFFYNGIEYAYEGLRVLVGFSEESNGEYFVAGSEVSVWDEELAYQACVREFSDSSTCEGVRGNG